MTKLSKSSIEVSSDAAARVQIARDWIQAYPADTEISVVARSIHSLQSEGKLNYFEPVATRPGFPIAVAKTLEELRMNEVEPDSLALLTRGGKDLAAIASLVEQELKESKLSD